MRQGILYPSEIIDGKLISGLTITRWVWADRVRYTLNKRREGAWRWLAARTPRELRRWVIVIAAVQAMGNDKSPDQIGYREIVGTCDSAREIAAREAAFVDA